MIMKNKILAEYEIIRSRNRALMEKEREDIYIKFPEIKEIDNEIYRAGAKNVKRIMKDPKKADDYNNDYKNILSELNKKRNQIIVKNNISPDFDKIKYDCEKCKDTAFLPDGKRCDCFNKKIINERYKKSNLFKNMQKENFDTFSFDYYSKEKIKGYNISPYENMERIYKRCKNFCDNFDNEDKGLLFYGGTGLGKTFLSSSIAKDLMDKGKTVLYLRASKLFSVFEDYRFSKLPDNDEINDIYDCDLLIIDDLGTEMQNKNNMSVLFDLVNERFSKNKKIIINTNYNLTELTKVYSSRFTSRIYEYFLIYGFFGEDIRILKLKK